MRLWWCGEGCDCGGVVKVVTVVVVMKVGAVVVMMNVVSVVVW